MYLFGDRSSYVMSTEFAIIIDRGTLIYLIPGRTIYFDGEGKKVADQSSSDKKNSIITKPFLLKTIKENPFNFEETPLIKNIRSLINTLKWASKDIQKQKIELLRLIINTDFETLKSAEKIDTIIFDIGGVFSFPDPNLEYKVAHWAVNNELAFDGLKPFKYDVKRHYINMEDIIDMFESTWKGLLAEGEHYTVTRAHKEFVSLITANAESVSPYLQTACDRYCGIYNLRFIATYAEDMLADLRQKGYKLYYLSNLCQFQLDQQRRMHRLDFLEKFDGGVFSCETPWRKPDERLYRFLIEKYQLNPLSSLFFDDAQENVDMAKKIGFNAMLFTSLCDSPYGQFNSSTILTTIKDLPSVV